MSARQDQGGDTHSVKLEDQDLCCAGEGRPGSYSQVSTAARCRYYLLFLCDIGILNEQRRVGQYG
jgi:hypothetical protein